MSAVVVSKQMAKLELDIDKIEGMAYRCPESRLHAREKHEKIEKKEKKKRERRERVLLQGPKRVQKFPNVW